MMVTMDVRVEDGDREGSKDSLCVRETDTTLLYNVSDLMNTREQSALCSQMVEMSSEPCLLCKGPKV